MSRNKFRAFMFNGSFDGDKREGSMIRASVSPGARSVCAIGPGTRSPKIPMTNWRVCYWRG
jgi:hypothetical protein